MSRPNATPPEEQDDSVPDGDKWAAGRGAHHRYGCSTRDQSNTRPGQGTSPQAGRIGPARAAAAAG